MSDLSVLIYRILAQMCFLLICFFACSSIALAATDRVALVIGNADYQTLPKLPNSLNDADDMAAKFGQLGFRVILLKNASSLDFRNALDVFETHLSEGGVGLFYFSGHGVQYEQKNYLVPVGSAIRSSADIVSRGISIDAIVQTLHAKERDFNIVILDACNDSALETQGLARMRAPTGTFIAFAASPGELASAGWNRNSLYTEHLLTHIDQPGQRIEDIFARTRKTIDEISLGAQIPTELAFLTKPFYFIQPKEPEGLRRPSDNLAIGETFRDDCTGCPKMVVVPPGTFLMGSDEGSDLERPVHSVTIDSPFAIGVYEVTVAEWKACVAEKDASIRCRQMPFQSAGATERFPIVNVSFDQAKSFTKWLAAKTGKAYRLPSEAEWEYAARGGTTAAFSWTQGAQAAATLNASGPTEVGSHAANNFGLHDVHGNVWEWVEDCFLNYTAEARGGTARTAGASCQSSIVRGGSWQYGANVATVSFRGQWNPATQREDVGLRVARTID